MAEPQSAGGKEVAERRGKRESKAARGRRVWCAHDGKDYVLFGAELTALRYATEHQMSCKPVEFGIPLSEQLK